MRTIVPPAQRLPSPRVTPPPPFNSDVPWRKITLVVGGIPLAVSTAVSLFASVVPASGRLAPAAFAEFAHPFCPVPELPHGHGTPPLFQAHTGPLAGAFPSTQVPKLPFHLWRGVPRSYQVTRQSWICCTVFG